MEKKETTVKNRGVLKQKGKKDKGRQKYRKEAQTRPDLPSICKAEQLCSLELWGRGAELKEHLGTVFLWWESAALFSFAILTLAFGRPLEADRMDKRADKFLLAEREFCNPTSNASVL